MPFLWRNIQHLLDSPLWYSNISLLSPPPPPQELFEGEVKHSEKLAERLQRSKDEAVQYKTRLK